MRKVILITLSTLVIILNSNIRPVSTDRMFFNDHFRPTLICSIQKYPIRFNDTIPNDTLHICYSGAGLPIAAFRNILTGVCLDGECRIVKIRIYWTITGRYLGYSLATGQELTKREHVSFTEQEYARLHQLLGDSVSLLKYYTLREIQPVKANVTTDGISGATLPDLSGYIVPEAAYTSHTLWHLVYGDSRDSLQSLIYRTLSAPLVDSLLKSTANYDKLWALKRISLLGLTGETFVPEIIPMLKIEDLEIVNTALAILSKSPVPDSTFQQELFLLTLSNKFEIRNIAVEWLRNTSYLHAGTAGRIICRLRGENLYMVNAYLSILEEKYIPTGKDLKQLRPLLKHKDSQIAFRVYTYVHKHDK